MGGSRVASTCKRWARQPCLCFQLLAPGDDDDRRTRRVDVRVVSWRNSMNSMKNHMILDKALQGYCMPCIIFKRSVVSHIEGQAHPSVKSISAPCGWCPLSELGTQAWQGSNIQSQSSVHVRVRPLLVTTALCLCGPPHMADEGARLPK